MFLNLPKLHYKIFLTFQVILQHNLFISHYIVEIILPLFVYNLPQVLITLISFSQILIYFLELKLLIYNYQVNFYEFL